MADLFADQIINGESTGASDLAGRTSSPSFVDLVLILCLVAKEQFSALCVSYEKVQGSAVYILCDLTLGLGQGRPQPSQEEDGLKSASAKRVNSPRRSPAQ